ncbi:hypothetical protein [Mycolicibacterium insubricum]|uniref:hypothetical protein n=1 Tax=Mycolicibacterium insubricum TaxID=444597 RepID=UPI002AE643FA|nr:hypothetical protein [Mycolicibacterium insubricum]
MTFTPDDYPGLRIEQPDLWWPYTMGSPNLYDLRLEYRRRCPRSPTRCTGRVSTVPARWARCGICGTRPTTHTG